MSDKAIKPEIIAAITAAVQAVTGGNGRVAAVRIKPSPMWALANKIKR
ncbi:MAG: hypothetical protein IJ668_03165 [Selenomonadaceae bacterium]|nr:hypothetical protein [Selenomonadaceae bacterium]MBR1579481.1 hypothetical protein [Selenomonadaceae bacterium]